MTIRIFKMTEVLTNKRFDTSNMITDCDIHGKGVKALVNRKCEVCFNYDKYKKLQQQLASIKKQFQDECGIGNIYRDASLYDAHHDQLELANKLKEYKFDTNLLIVGGVGVGKTHLVSALLNRVIFEKICRYVDFQNLTNIMIEEKSYYNELKNCDLLVIDELFNSSTIGYKEYVLYDLVKYRINKGLYTIYITNLDVDELKNVLGTALYDRMRYKCVVLKLEGESKRDITCG